MSGNYLEIGVIDGLPPSPEEIKRRCACRLSLGVEKLCDDQGDDCYYTVHCGGNEENMYNHDHPERWKVFLAPKNLPKKLVAELIAVHEDTNKEYPLTATD